MHKTQPNAVAAKFSAWKRALVALSAGCALNVLGCAVQPVVIDATPQKYYDAPVQSVEVEDYAVSRPIRTFDFTYVNGWVPIHIGFSPELHEVFTSRLRSGLRGGKQEGTLSIAVVDTGLFMEKDIADDIVFVGIVANQRERGFKCSAILNVKMNGKSTRRVFEHGTKRKLFKDGAEKRDFVTACHEALTEQVFNFVSGKFVESCVDYRALAQDKASCAEAVKRE